jgi:hypothetical protein
MNQNKSVLIVGIDPALIDFSSPEFAQHNLTAQRVPSEARAEIERLHGLGYQADWCMTDFGETVERVLEEKLKGSLATAL